MRDAGVLPSTSLHTAATPLYATATHCPGRQGRLPVGSCGLVLVPKSHQSLIYTDMRSLEGFKMALRRAEHGRDPPTRTLVRVGEAPSAGHRRGCDAKKKDDLGTPHPAIVSVKCCNAYTCAANIV